MYVYADFDFKGPTDTYILSLGCVHINHMNLSWVPHGVIYSFWHSNLYMCTLFYSDNMKKFFFVYLMCVEAKSI